MKIAIFGGTGDLGRGLAITFAAAGHEDVMAQPLEHALADVQYHVLIVDEQKGLSAGDGILRGVLFGGHRFVGGGQVDGEGRSHAFGALHRDDALMILHNAVGGGEPQPRPSPSLLGGEERFEYTGERRVVDPDSRIGDGNLDETAGFYAKRAAFLLCKFDGPGLNADVAAGRHGLGCVDEQIEQRLLNLSFVHLDGPAVLLVYRVNRYVFPGGGEYRHRSLDDRRGVTRPDFVLPASRKPEELLGELRAALDLGLDILQPLVVRVAFLCLEQHEGGVSLNRHEEVVEVVRDAARERADGLQLLGLVKLRFEFLTFLSGMPLLGDIPQNAQEMRPALVLDNRSGGLHVHT